MPRSHHSHNPHGRANHVVGEHLLPPDVARRLRHTIAEAMHTPSNHKWREYGMCPLCSHVSMKAHGTGQDPMTMVCRGRIACAVRRGELDNETIEFLGLVPRGKEGNDGQE